MKKYPCSPSLLFGEKKEVFFMSHVPTTNGSGGLIFSFLKLHPAPARICLACTTKHIAAMMATQAGAYLSCMHHQASRCDDGDTGRGSLGASWGEDDGLLM